MTSHVDTETLALLAEGLLEESEERSVQAHVSECGQCAEQVAALADVSRVLAEVPAPPLPDGLAERIDEALRSESRQRPNAPGGAHAPSIDEAARVTPLRRKSGPTRWMPYLVAAAAAVFVIGGGAAVLNTVLGSQAPGLQTEPSTQDQPDAALAYHPVVVSSGTDYTEDRLAEQGASVIERSSLAAAPESDGEETAASPLATDTTDLPSDVSSCVRGLDEEKAARPVLLDIAEYEGEPAWIMVFEGAAGAAGPDGYGLRVVSTDCSEGKGPADTTLAETSIPGP
ncbi:anti-sigma factor RsiW [Spinactinospora alkalitolerans]|uniref:Anti-sigma factor RsiW n=1 Tax=Spinactinospora alkalitolerans TaxID=687207 RepID=A0A852U360_9ACTN|nr:hypothetical protein [Spinactinospora alkalitolerans]NYE50668.1 anti-sigma factor RsiW [Spinactinospora alkalitolerans]